MHVYIYENVLFIDYAFKYSIHVQIILKYIHACICIIHSTHIYYVNRNFYFGCD